jgi:Reverse transcriptase (RNA-dependent DNA polymerase)
MTRASNYKNTPGGNQSTYQQMATRYSDSGEPGLTRPHQRKSEFSSKLPLKIPSYIGTFNINTLIQPGKLLNLTTELDRQKILILAVQETRYTDEETADYGNYRIFKSKTDKRIARGAPHLGMAFIVHKSVLKSIKEVTPVNNRLMTMRIQCANKKYTMINVHAPTNVDNKKNPIETEKFWEKLENVMAKVPKDDIKILLGDFNAQIGREKFYKKTVGNYPAHKFTNKNGTRLIALCQQNNLKIMSTSLRKFPRKQKTWRSPIQQIGEFQIDHVAISFPVQKEIYDVQVRRGANIDSDHYLTRIKIKFTARRSYQKKTRIQKYDTKMIEESKVKEEWEKEKANTWEEFHSKITRIAQENIPLKKRFKHPWWNSDCENALEGRKKAFQEYNTKKSEESQHLFNEIRKQVAKSIRQAKRKYMKTQLNSIEENFRNYNTRDFYRTFADKIRGYTPQNLCFRKQDGKLALTNQENCQELAQYFSNLLNCPEPSTRFTKEDCANAHPKSQPPTQEEIQNHIKKLKNNRTSGEDGIIAELLKNLGPNTLQELTKIINNIWETEKLPEDWKCALIHPLHKKGDRTDVNNYRGISLLQVTYKILSACLLKRTQEQLEHKIGEYQAGFRPGRSCVEQIFNLKTIFKHKAIRNAPIVCTFVDFKKAYDSVDRQALFNILEELGLDSKTLQLIKETLTDTTSKVKFMGEISEPFIVKTGVRQGDGLSPLLFNLVLDKVIKEWEKELKNQALWKPIRIGRPKDKIEISCLAFADDLAILADTEETATKQIEILKECADRVGLQISFQKTEFFCTKLNIKFLNTKYGKIKKVKHFKYLGEVLEPTGGEKVAQKMRQQKMKRAYGMTHEIYNKKCISLNTKIRHYCTVIKPAALYASETLTLHTKCDIEKILKEERKIMRKILGSRLTEEGYRLQSIKTTENISNLAADIRRRRLKFYGHITRLPPSRLTNRILTYIQKVKSTTPWITQVKLDLQKAQIGASDVIDRKTFRDKVEKWIVKSEKEAPKKPGTKWTEERRRIHGERMKEVWRKRCQNVLRDHPWSIRNK